MQLDETRPRRTLISDKSSRVTKSGKSDVCFVISNLGRIGRSKDKMNSVMQYETRSELRNTTLWLSRNDTLQGISICTNPRLMRSIPCYTRCGRKFSTSIVQLPVSMSESTMARMQDRRFFTVTSILYPEGKVTLKILAEECEESYLANGPTRYSANCFGMSNKRTSVGQKSGVKKVRKTGVLFSRIQTPFFGHYWGVLDSLSL